jgi:hypothetical protein
MRIFCLWAVVVLSVAASDLTPIFVSTMIYMISVMNSLIIIQMESAEV